MEKLVWNPDDYKEKILFQDENYTFLEVEHLKNKGVFEIQIINENGDVVDSIFKTKIRIHERNGLYNAIVHLITVLKKVEA